MNENQLLKQKLYARTLDYKSVNFKIQELKESLGVGAEVDNTMKRY